MALNEESEKMVELREWQQQLEEMLQTEAVDYRVVFAVDNQGKSGKKWFLDYYTRKFPETSQHLKPQRGKSMSKTLNEDMDVYFLEIPKGAKGKKFDYAFLHDIKTKLPFDKAALIKQWPNNCHCVVFCDQMPDMTKLSKPQYEIYHIRDNKLIPHA